MSQLFKQSTVHSIKLLLSLVFLMASLETYSSPSVNPIPLNIALDNVLNQVANKVISAPQALNLIIELQDRLTKQFNSPLSEPSMLLQYVFSIRMHYVSQLVNTAINKEQFESIVLIGEDLKILEISSKMEKVIPRSHEQGAQIRMLGASLNLAIGLMTQGLDTKQLTNEWFEASNNYIKFATSNPKRPVELFETMIAESVQGLANVLALQNKNYLNTQLQTVANHLPTDARKMIAKVLEGNLDYIYERISVHKPEIYKTTQIGFFTNSQPTRTASFLKSVAANLNAFAEALWKGLESNQEKTGIGFTAQLKTSQTVLTCVSLLR